MAARIDEVSVEAKRTDRHAIDVHTNTAALAGAVGDLRHAVVRVVRTSTTEVDRRATPRTEVDLRCRVTAAGLPVHDARLVDLSESGACIADAPALAPGASGSLVLDAAGAPLPFTVRSAGDGLLHVAFGEDDASAARLRAMLDRLSPARAAEATSAGPITPSELVPSGRRPCGHGPSGPVRSARSPASARTVILPRSGS
jgi:hypothetical protein